MSTCSALFVTSEKRRRMGKTYSQCLPSMWVPIVIIVEEPVPRLWTWWFHCIQYLTIQMDSVIFLQYILILWSKSKKWTKCFVVDSSWWSGMAEWNVCLTNYVGHTWTWSGKGIILSQLHNPRMLRELIRLLRTHHTDYVEVSLWHWFCLSSGERMGCGSMPLT
jgi:hypothetical protein